jgi:hypothetical protein
MVTLGPMAQATIVILIVILMTQRKNIMFYYYVKVFFFKSHKCFIERFLKTFKKFVK